MESVIAMMALVSMSQQLPPLPTADFLRFPRDFRSEDPISRIGTLPAIQGKRDRKQNQTDPETPCKLEILKWLAT